MMDPAPKSRQAAPAPPSAGAPTPRNGEPPAPAFEDDQRLPSNLSAFPRPIPVSPPGRHEMPPWLQRGLLVVFVAFCIELGLVLIGAPWFPHLWENNSLIAAYPGVRALMANDFVRGAVSGVGLLNIWLGIYEAVHYREARP